MNSYPEVSDYVSYDNIVVQYLIIEHQCPLCVHHSQLNPEEREKLLE